jgi:hypothetical protein
MLCAGRTMPQDMGGRTRKLARRRHLQDCSGFGAGAPSGPPSGCFGLIPETAGKNCSHEQQKERRNAKNTNTNRLRKKLHFLKFLVSTTRANIWRIPCPQTVKFQATRFLYDPNLGHMRLFFKFFNLFRVTSISLFGVAAPLFDFF